MSLCVLLQRENEIYMAGDSRVSVEMEGKKYRWNDNYSKIEQVGNFVIFKGSSADVMNNIVDKFKESYVKDLATYQRICAEEYDNYRIREGINFKPYSETKKMIVSTLIATIECNKPVVYFISDLSNFKIVKIKLPDDKDIQDVILGVRCDEAGKIYRNCTFDFGNFDNVFDNYLKIYEGVTGEEIGGTLTLFHITNEGIKNKKCGLMNTRYINEFSNYLLERNHADLRYKGFANCDELLIRDVNILDEVNNIKGDFLSENSIGIGKLKLNELYVGTGGIRLDPSAVISWNNLPNDVASIDQIPTSPSDIGALPASALPSYITSTKITKTTIESPNIVGGTISSNTTINVGTDATIGNNLYLNPSNWSGIHWGSTGVNLYSDSGAKSLILNAPGGVYAGSQRIDQPPAGAVAVFG